jgi:thiamine-phosphate pyrophosphorylase
MQLIVISSPVAKEGEWEALNEMFAAGLECFHLRKPGFSEQDYLEGLKQIKPTYLKRVMLHSHFQLAAKYNVRGLHFTGEALKKLPAEDLKVAIKTAKRKGMQVSRGVHSLEEVAHEAKLYNYLLLSPVFDSISKPGYTAAFDLEEVRQYLQRYQGKAKIMALGGVKVDNVAQLKEAGFHGAAALGTIWEAEDPVGTFKLIRHKIPTKE